MAWYLNRALSNFRAAVNTTYPRRDKTSDGTIGDAAHQATNSDHNQDPDGSVDAWDMDVELNGTGQPYAADVEHLKGVFERHESSRYWIHNGQIATRSNGWRREQYTGTNPHTKHVHWNSRESHEDSQQPWEVETMPTPEEIASAVWAHQHNHPTRAGERQTKGTVIQFMDAVHDDKQARLIERLSGIEARLDALAIADPITDEQLERVLYKVIFGPDPRAEGEAPTPPDTPA